MRAANYFLGATAAALLALPVSAATLPGVGTFEGVAGIGTSNGVVDNSPLGKNYVYVTTAGSVYLGAGLGLGDETNGSELTTVPFTAKVGSKLDLFFNYVTSDGAGFADYAYVFLTNLATGMDTELFTARTTPAGDTVPGFGLPAINPAVTLIPPATPIIDGGPVWDELGSYSGQCWDLGCGYTDWINALYTFDTAGDYSLTFGVVNWDDTDFDTGLAIAGISLDDEEVINPNPIPLPAAGWLMIAGIGGLAALRRRKSV